ncbi:MAG: hypothetical protein K0R07_2284 [Sedimentibacter sp.]|jgi:hypothetical protein|nr:hypothetical protein [Sedimentibacter sp.]
MAKKSARNNDLLKEAKSKASPQIYALLINLINQDREDLAELVLKVDYLVEYTNTCIRQKDLDEAKDCLPKVKSRIDTLKNEGADTDYLYYLYEGLIKKINN